jgi:acetylornithine deacetylase/succinyl-diaminopimelate desuccinylase-like protein
MTPDEVVRRTIELAQIPAPTGLEAARQERVRTWWLEDGWPDVHADEVGNVWARAAAGALRAAGQQAVFTGASTDANAAHAAGIPAAAIGVTTGGGEHTPGEWIETSQLGTGLRCAAATITGWERGALEGGGA